MTSYKAEPGKPIPDDFLAQFDFCKYKLSSLGMLYFGTDAAGATTAVHVHENTSAMELLVYCEERIYALKKMRELTGGE